MRIAATLVLLLPTAICCSCNFRDVCHPKPG
jgi:hypothetical protein